MPNDFKDDNREKQVTMKVTFDYGEHIKGKITPLLDGNYIFFDLKEYGLSQIYPGDYLTITYVGKMTATESYPGIVDVNSLTIKDVEYHPGHSFLINEANIKRDENNKIEVIWNYTQHEFVILDEKLNYCLLSEYSGDRVYATVGNKQRTLLTSPSLYPIDALFAFDPYNEEK